MSEIVEIKDGEDIVRLARKDNKWLGTIDIYGHGKVKLEVVDVVAFKDVPMQGGRRESGLALKFKQTPKMLILNAGNNVRFATNYGRTPEEVRGKTVTLEAVKLEKPYMNKTHGIYLS